VCILLVSLLRITSTGLTQTLIHKSVGIWPSFKLDTKELGFDSRRWRGILFAAVSTQPSAQWT